MLTTALVAWSLLLYSFQIWIDNDSYRFLNDTDSPANEYGTSMHNAVKVRSQAVDSQAVSEYQWRAA